MTSSGLDTSAPLEREPVCNRRVPSREFGVSLQRFLSRLDSSKRNTSGVELMARQCIRGGRSRRLMSFPTFRPRKSALGILEDATGHEFTHEGRIGSLGGGVELSFGVLAVCLPLVVVAAVRKRPGIAAIRMERGPATRTGMSLYSLVGFG